MTCLQLFKEKIKLITELTPMLKEFLFETSFDKNEEIEGWETLQIASYLKEQISWLMEII